MEAGYSDRSSWASWMSTTTSRSRLHCLPSRGERALARLRGAPVAGKGAVELVAGVDVELGKDLVQVVLNRKGADEEPGADVEIREPVAGEPSDLGLLCGEVGAGLDGAFTGGRAGRQQLAHRALGERLEERVRDASTFCGAVIKTRPEQTATALGPAQGALTAVADSLAAHFGDWGAASRFTSGDGADSPRMPGSDEPIGFEQHVKPLFRERDRDSMRSSFDLWSLEDVSTHADAILHRLDAGTMPCDGAWPAERVAVFRRWIDAGKPA